MKRIFSALLAFVLVFTFIPFFEVETEATLLRPDKSVYYIRYTCGNGASGGSFTDGPFDVGSSTVLKYASELGFKKDGYYCTGWSIGSQGSTYTNRGSGALGEDKQYYVTATAQWAKEGTSSSSSSSESSSSSSSSSESSSSSAEKRYTVTYKAGEAGTSSVKQTYKYDTPFKLIDNPFQYAGHKFKGWEYQLTGTIYKAGQAFQAPNEDLTFVAIWEKDGDSESSSSSSSSKPSSSSSSSSKPSSGSSESSSSSSSSKPVSSIAPSSSRPSSSVAPSSSESESVSESEVSSESSSSVIEEPETDIYEPVKLAFSIEGDIPVTKIEFELKEDIGGTPSLGIVPVDGYSVTDEAAAKFIADGDALAAFDISVLADGAAYTEKLIGTVTYELNGTQASAVSNYGSYVLAMAHTVKAGTYEGEYYATDGDGTYLYNTETDFKSAVENVKLVEEDGVYRLVIKDPSGLSAFAYKASENTVVEIKLIPSASAASASIDVTSLSPVLLVQIEVGSGKVAGGIPAWVWIVIAAAALLIIALVALFLINRNTGKRSANSYDEQTGFIRTSSVITGLDDDE